MAVHYGEGSYVARVEEQAFETSKNGKPMIVFRVRPTARVFNEGFDNEEHHPVDGKWDRTIRVVISPDNADSMDYALRKLRYAGFMGERFEDLNLVGADVRCYVKEDKYDGKDVEQWDLALPRLERKPLENDNSVAKSLNALFGRKLKETAAEAQPAQPEPAAAVSSDDEVPF